ncbi:MAG: galactonate dehydratase [SAR202 cluster bacterium]|nr:galactonate dehydratase [Dehalococcoidia bacterium]MDP6425477.1 galactonate dehydratase [Dehalococcoidia bacterium]MDP7232040.1 galactonate dehydratase [Dehalococcoidia bacterium]MDP7612415.1 galactonate dehydratase [Dehalococcoidia bacterium]MQG47506.1 galactonate dehydratase [SAR202 cluster bacterium]
MATKTKIEKIETILWDRWLLIKIYCEDGTVGFGEGGVHGWQRPTKTMVETMSHYLVGKDPSRIEHHYQWLYRSSHFMGSVVQGALSAIDIALWDIKGKQFQTPIYDLLGGKTRDRVRCYMHVNGNTIDDLVSDSLEKVSQGFTAVRFTPFSPNYYLHKSYSEWADEAVKRVGAVKDAVGNSIDICVEIHRQMSPSESIALGKRLEQFNPFFYEDPMLPDSPAVMGNLQQNCNIPIATGERFTTIYEYQQLLENNGCSYVRPDLCLCGGISGSKKVASMAEAQHIKVIPHNPLSPISTAACVQLDACIPNFALQEYTGESESPKSDLLKNPLKLIDGYLTVPEGPGLGVIINDEALNQPETPKVLDTPIGYDGSVQDR